jgi:hypothetical protein
MEVEFIKMQVGYYENGRFQSHGLTSSPKKFKMFLDSLLKMQENAGIEWASYPKLEWEYVFKNRGTLVVHTSTLHTKWGTMHYLLFCIWTKRNMNFGHLLKHVTSAMFNNFDGGKEEMSIM